MAVCASLPLVVQMSFDIPGQQTMVCAHCSIVKEHGGAVGLGFGGRSRSRTQSWYNNSQPSMYTNSQMGLRLASILAQVAAVDGLGMGLQLLPA